MRASKTLLDSVNWDFPTSLPGVGTSLHWYPGTFPNALPATLIQAFTNPGDLVFDPYGGVGTTAFEAIRQSRRAITTDANPIAVAISLFSCFLISAHQISPLYVTSIFDELLSVVARMEKHGQSSFSISPLDEIDLGKKEVKIRKLISRIEKTFDGCVAGPPQIELLEPWFHPESLKNLLAVRRFFVDEQSNVILRLGGMVMLSAILRPSSSQTASWGHVADNVLPKELVLKSIASQCKSWLTRVGRLMRGVEIFPPRDDSCEGADVQLLNWLEHDEKALTPYTGNVNLLVTSPPYASAIDYTLAQRLSHYFFGYSDADVMGLVGKEIGARRKRFHAAPEEIWATQLATSLEAQLKLMRPDGIACVVLPHKESGRLLGAVAFETIMKDQGWRLLWSGSRSIRQSRTRQSWTSIQKEDIQIFVGGAY